MFELKVNSVIAPSRNTIAYINQGRETVTEISMRVIQRYSTSFVNYSVKQQTYHNHFHYFVSVL